jgi:hypothetical protein
MKLATLFPSLIFLAIAACGHARPTGGGGGGGLHADSTGPVPPAVRQTIDTVLGPGARVTSEREGGATIYEAAIQTKLELEVSAAGVLQKTEIALPTGSLPSAVTAALAGKGAITEAEVVVTPTGVAFEVEVGDDEYLVDAAGTIREQAHESDAPGDDDD